MGFGINPARQPLIIPLEQPEVGTLLLGITWFRNNNRLPHCGRAMFE
jgi:hypothetical protein